MTGIATWLLWDVAGRPSANDGGDPPGWYEDHRGTCWWCGLDAEGLCRRAASLPSTFPPLPRPARADCTHLCPACSWSLSDNVTLPPDRAAEQQAKRLADGGRVKLLVDGVVTRRLAMVLDIGQVGLWGIGTNAAAERPWTAARRELRGAPRDIGPCGYLGAVDQRDLQWAPTAKFRNYHHFGREGGDWRPWTAAHKPLIRRWLLDPPATPWVGVIGDGQKHTVIHAVVSSGVRRLAGQQADMFAGPTNSPMQQVYYLGSVVSYRPRSLAGWLAAVEDLVGVGARDEEILSGRYRSRTGLDWLRALRRSEPVISQMRGSPALDLALYLRRPQKELTC